MSQGCNKLMGLRASFKEAIGFDDWSEILAIFRCNSGR
jgi:hypothetical protein